jgi:hypothetical protein
LHVFAAWFVSCQNCDIAQHRSRTLCRLVAECIFHPSTFTSSLAQLAACLCCDQEIGYTFRSPVEIDQPDWWTWNRSNF